MRNIFKLFRQDIKTAIEGIFVILIVISSLFLGTVFQTYTNNPSVINNSESYLKDLVARLEASPTPTSNSIQKAVPTPEPKIITSRLNNNHKLKPDINGYALFHKNDSQSWEWRQPIKIYNNHISDFYYSESENIIYLTQKSELYDNGFEYVTKIIPPENIYEDIKLENLNVEETYIYSFTKILDYFPDQQMLILSTQSGDGCGSGGYIWTLEENKKEKVINHYSGCSASDQFPEYIDYLGNGQILLFDRSPGAQYEQANNTIERIYVLNILDNIETTLVTRDQFPKDFHYINWDTSNGYFFTHSVFNENDLQTDNEVYLFNLEERSFTLVESE